MTTLENQQAHQEALDIIRNLRAELTAALTAKEKAEQELDEARALHKESSRVAGYVAEQRDEARKELDEARKAMEPYQTARELNFPEKVAMASVLGFPHMAGDRVLVIFEAAAARKDAP